MTHDQQSNCPRAHPEDHTRLAQVLRLIISCHIGDGYLAASDGAVPIENGGRGGAGADNSTATTDTERTQITYGQVTQHEERVFPSVLLVVFSPLGRTQNKRLTCLLDDRK